MPLAFPPVGGPYVAQVRKTEEKGSDVNLATYLLLDGFDQLYDVAVVVSNDSDLVEPVRLACERFAPVHVISPNPHHNVQLAGAAASYGLIPAGLIQGSQLPATVTLPNGKVVTGPVQWS
jgi:hypothetical protein